MVFLFSNLALMTFLFLYTEIAEYFLACCKQLTAHGDVHIVRWPVNKEAPFQFELTEKLQLYTKSDYTFEQLQHLVETINPDVIICSGWIDKDYLKITKPYFNKIPTVMTCDTHWRGDLKQRIASILSRFTLLKTFSHAWVPGGIQKEYVLHLGFKETCISTGFYSCDLAHFESIYQSQKESKAANFPKRFLFVGRYYDFKGITELWEAFIQLQQEQPNDWELWCLGAGDIAPVKRNKIKHFGFIQPKELSHYTSQTGVFILPSRYEPWGVVVHEYAASGFPLLLSNQVGAKDQFLEEGKNGYGFEANNIADIKNSLLKIINLSETELIAMAEESHQLSKTISPETWVNSVLEFKLR